MKDIRFTDLEIKFIQVAIAKGKTAEEIYNKFPFTVKGRTLSSIESKMEVLKNEKL